jgi:ribosome-binding factor A
MNESNRQRKVAQIIQEDFAELFRKQAAESNRNFLVSVSDVKVTADLSIAKIYLSIFPQEFRKIIMKEIEENKSQYRNFIGQKMGKQVRIIPELQFYLDTSLDDVERIEKELTGEGDNPVL